MATIPVETHPAIVPPPGRLIIRTGTIWLTYVVMASIVRLVLSSQVSELGWLQDFPEFMSAMAIGVLRDMAVATLLLAPFYWLLASWNRPWRSRAVRIGLQVLVILGIITFVFDDVAEIFFWNEFASRLNGIAVNYLIFPREVIGNLSQSFDLEVYLPLVGAAGIALWLLLRRAIRKATAPQIVRPGFLRGTATAGVAVAIAIAILSLLPRDISANREINELAENGLATMVTAVWTNGQDYEGVYPTISETEAIRLTREMVRQDNTKFVDPDGTLSIRRLVDNGTAPSKLNIVMVTEESLGADYVTGLDSKSPIPVTPHLAELAKKGMFFTNIYASGDRTVRGLEATETSFQPIPGISTARRPESAGMYSLPRLLHQFGYTSGVLYGGFNAFDNMGTFWRGIGFDHVWDQRDIRHDAFSTIWGVSDEDLFTEALRRLDENAADGKPFLLTMMTVSNHRPFLFPDHFKTPPEMIDKRERGAAYADWAFNNFVERARSHAWFDNTVFVLVADHGQKINGAAQVPLEKFRIPMLFYAPKHIAPQRVDTLGAQIDLIPTLLGVLGFSYESPFFGIDLRHVPSGGGRISVAHNFSIAFASGDNAVVLDPNNQLKGYKFEKAYVPLTPSQVDPETRDKAIAVTQTAHRMFYSSLYGQGGS